MKSTWSLRNVFCIVNRQHKLWESFELAWKIANDLLVKGFPIGSIIITGFSLFDIFVTKWTLFKDWAIIVLIQRYHHFVTFLVFFWMQTSPNFDARLNHVLFLDDVSWIHNFAGGFSSICMTCKVCLIHCKGRKNFSEEQAIYLTQLLFSAIEAFLRWRSWRISLDV